MKQPSAWWKRECNAERISRGFVFSRGNIFQKISETAELGKFGTIVVGHRDAVSFFQAYVRGRFADTLIKTLDHMAVWSVAENGWLVRGRNQT